MSVCGTSRVTGTNKGAVLRLIAEIRFVHDLPAKRPGAGRDARIRPSKAKCVPEKFRDNPDYGSVWTRLGLAADSRLIVSYLVGAPRSRGLQDVRPRRRQEIMHSCRLWGGTASCQAGPRVLHGARSSRCLLRGQNACLLGIQALTFRVNSVDITFRREKLRKVCNDGRLLAKEYGRERAVKIQLRLDQLGAASTLADIAALPAARCHELQGERRRQLAVDLVHPWRLIFTPLEWIEKEAGGLDWSKVEAVVIEEIVDYH